MIDRAKDCRWLGKGDFVWKIGADGGKSLTKDTKTKNITASHLGVLILHKIKRKNTILRVFGNAHNNNVQYSDTVFFYLEKTSWNCLQQMKDLVEEIFEQGRNDCEEYFMACS